MDTIEQLAREAFEPKLGRAMSEEEAAEYAMHLRRFAAFLIDCAKDTELMERLGLKGEGEGSAAPRVVNNTTQTDGEPLREALQAKTDPPTGAPLRDTSTHRGSSASPAVSAAITPVHPVEATVPGRSS